MIENILIKIEVFVFASVLFQFGILIAILYRKDTK